jgi:uncharacterized membrane protein YqiK
MEHEKPIPEGAVFEALELRAPHDALCRHALELLKDYRKDMKRIAKERDTAQISCINLKNEYEQELAKARAEALMHANEFLRSRAECLILQRENAKCRALVKSLSDLAKELNDETNDN